MMVQDESVRSALARLGSEPALAPAIRWLERRYAELQSGWVHGTSHELERGKAMELEELLNEIRLAVQQRSGRMPLSSGGGFG